ncbi:MAG: hypothetical protein A3G25_05385 [Betaproteobacteria bacterium RIFCSPLOWO2_12_FULL_63_13]|nr:MAG: hypothetical protein A3G25_05385 [Betaproteobacteria bacterium RIFCSPLOWO2_12_FULL_63_13]
MSAIDSDVVRSRLTLLQHHLRRVEARCPGTPRERVANEYAGIDWAIVFGIASRDIRDVKEFGKAMAALISEPQPPGERTVEHALDIRSTGSNLPG